MYAAGKCVVQDFPKAAQWFKLAADQGHAGAQYNLGMALHQDLFPPRTKVKLAGLKATSLNGKRGVVVEGNAALGRWCWWTATQSPKHFRLRTWLWWLRLPVKAREVGDQLLHQLHPLQPMLPLPLLAKRSVERKMRKLPGKRRRSKLRSLVVVVLLLLLLPTSSIVSKGGDPIREPAA